MNVRAARILSAGCATTGAGMLVATVAGVAAGGYSFRDVVDSYTLTNSAIGTGFVVCGSLITWHRPANATGWLFVACGLGHLGTASLAAPFDWGVHHDWPEPLTRTLSTLVGLLWQFGLVGLFSLALLLFPTGRLPSHRWRPLAWLIIASMLWQMSTFALSDGGPGAGPGARPFPGIGLAVPAPVEQGATLLSAGIVLAVILALVLRYRRGTDSERRQVLWLVLAVIVFMVVNSQRWLTGDGPVLLLLSTMLVPIAVCVAILRHQLLDIRMVVSRTLLYVLASIAVLAAYAGIVAALTMALPTGENRTFAAVGALIVALGFAPFRTALQRLLDRALFGSRSDPVGTVARLGAGFESVENAGSVVALLRQDLRLPYLALRDAAGSLLEAGSLAGDSPVSTVPLSSAGRPVGELLVGLRPGEKRLHERDAAVLAAISPSLGLALHATALTGELRRSRAGIVAAREIEQQRLHQELHDGLGPVLTGAAYRADAAANLLAKDPGEARVLLELLKFDLREALDSVRRVVAGMRPLDLEEQGLHAALSLRASNVVDRNGTHINVELSWHGALENLTPATELAVYRIVVESLTNIARHSSASHSMVRVSLDGGIPDGDVQVEVTDDGQCGAAPWTPGVGLRSIAARAEELGGSATAGPTSLGGRVFARLPVG